MKRNLWLFNLCCFIILILVLIFYITHNNLINHETLVENFRGRRHRRRHRFHHPRRRWMGPHWGYRYGPPPFIAPVYQYTWYNPFSWFAPICKEGCVSIGFNEYGCQRPGIGPNQCIFASDCAGC